MVDINIFTNKVNYIENNLKKLQILRQLTEEEFSDKFYYCGSAKYYLQTCIEAMIDIAHHIVKVCPEELIATKGGNMQQIKHNPVVKVPVKFNPNESGILL